MTRSSRCSVENQWRSSGSVTTVTAAECVMERDSGNSSGTLLQRLASQVFLSLISNGGVVHQRGCSMSSLGVMPWEAQSAGLSVPAICLHRAVGSPRVFLLDEKNTVRHKGLPLEGVALYPLKSYRGVGPEIPWSCEEV